MKNIFRKAGSPRAALGLAALALCAAPGKGGAGEIDWNAIRASMTFDANYENSINRENADAERRGRTIAGRVVPEGRKTAFEILPMETISYGLRVGKGEAAVVYPSQGHLTPGAGAMELVVKNLDWDYALDKSTHLFVSALGPEMVMYVYKFNGNGLGVYLENRASKKKVFPYRMPIEWKRNTRHHAAVVWDGAEVRLYLDGEKTHTVEFEPIARFPDEFQVGARGNFGADAHSAIGYLRLYDRALSDGEIAALAVRALPDLKIGALDAGKISDEILSGSPWFQTRPRLAREALDSGYAPPPWTPVSFDGKRAEVWNRVYDFSGGGPMAAVESAGRPLLAGPARLEVGAGGRRSVLSFSPPDVIEAGAGRLVFERRAEGAVLRGTLEYDGMLWWDLALRPAGTLERLALVLPMTDKAARAVHYVAAMGEDPRSAVAPMYSNSRSLPDGAGVVFSREFVTHLWVGDSDGGLQFFVESDQYWWPRGRKNVMEIERGAAGVDVRVNLVDAPLPDNAPAELRYGFGLIATPVRPMPDGWRSKRMTQQWDRLTGEDRGDLLIYWPDDWAPVPYDPEPFRAMNRDKVADKLRRDRREGRKIVPYWNRTHLTMGGKGKINPDGDRVLEAWGRLPQRPRGGSLDMIGCAATSGWSDYLVWCVDQWSEIFEVVDGVYIDEMAPKANKNPYSGGGYDDFDGSRRPTYACRADRDLYRRMAHVLRARGGERENWSVAHASGTHMMEILGPFPVILTGEHLYSGYFPNDPELIPPAGDRLYYYSYSLPIDRVKTEFYWKAWGAAIAWLPCMKNQRDIMELPVPTRDMLSRIMQADVIVWPMWCDKEEVYKTWRFRDDFGIGNPGVAFVPYWENTLVAADRRPEGIVIGYYRDGDKLLVLVSNLNREPADIRMEFGDFPVRSLKNAETAADIGDFHVTIPRNDYIALRVNY